MLFKPLPLIALAALVLAGCNASNNASAPSGSGPAQPLAAAVTAPNGQDWLTTYAATPDGGFVKGNPNAAVKLVEYFSPSCPHCKLFANGARAGINAAVSSGRMSYEMRPLLLPHPYDPAADVLLRCGGGATFFPLSEAMFAAQDNTFKTLEAIDKDNAPKWQAMQPEAAYADMADKLGLISMAQQFGMTTDKAKACLADKANYTALQNISAGADKYKITGTPSFVINGAAVTLPDNVEASWDLLKPYLRNAGAL
ncbi:MAG: thioredoxin domain-containing protein [Alphaproteobacteria bacterium]|nr:thioredoxin domain-containing protein [Alphaproteobacteria bacterium]MDE2341720.1 thioredoxin domain-containing protein [Alphaproteobacteria bacterium]